MSIYFSGEALPQNKLDGVFSILGSYKKFDFSTAWLRNTCRYWLKPAVNTFSTTKGKDIYLASDFFTLAPMRQAQILLHESAHSMDSLQVGLYWWLAKYLANPWYRLDAELAGLAMEIQWDIANHSITPAQFLYRSNTEADKFMRDYMLWPIARSTVQAKILNVIQGTYTRY